MANNTNKSYSAISDVNVWMKLRANDTLMLSDVPSILAGRWSYFKNSWDFIKQTLLDNASATQDPDYFIQQVEELSKFIASQRTAPSRINPFADGSIIYTYFMVFDNIAINSIDLTNEETKIVDDLSRNIKNFSKNDFVVRKNIIREERDRLTDIYGLTDEDYNNVYRRSPIAKQVTATTVDLNYLQTLQESIKNIDFILANLFAVDAAVDPFAIARANANNPDINIGQYKSGNLVKMEYGDTLQGIAYRYLGSSDRWVDIAIANGLRPPYIDEVGIAVALLSNGSNNQINIGETDSFGNLNIDKFYINQFLFIQSDLEKAADQRQIVDIKQIPVSGEIILVLDGQPNLNKYKTVDNVYIRVFKPNTINSSFYVLIPSTQELDNPRQEETPWFLAKSSESEKRAKTDLAIGSNGDLSFTTNGDIRLSYGMDNAIQAVKLKFLTEEGALRYHPGYGLISISGSTINNASQIRQAITQSINDQIAADSRFERVESLNVELVRPESGTDAPFYFGVQLSVRMAGSSTVIPISFSVNLS